MGGVGVTRVYIASPFRGSTKEETRQNIVYARLCMRDSLERGEAPYLSHLLYTQVWAETEAQREAGLKAGDAWREVSELVAVYTDLGVTEGMRRALQSSVTSVGRTLGGGALPVTINGWRRHLATLTLGGFPELER
jgi:hypothetical protein